MNILIVDDQQNSHDLLSIHLNELNFKSIQHAYNGQEAYEKLEECEGDRSFDLVFCDINMPILDGAGFTEKVRGSGKSFANIPIIIVTSESGSESFLNVIEKGASSFINKPYSVSDIKSKIDLVVGKREVEP